MELWSLLLLVLAMVDGRKEEAKLTNMQDLSPLEQIFDIHKLTISETGWAAWD
jgi:hypothetical protein